MQASAVRWNEDDAIARQVLHCEKKFSFRPYLDTSALMWYRKNRCSISVVKDTPMGPPWESRRCKETHSRIERIFSPPTLHREQQKMVNGMVHARCDKGQTWRGDHHWKWVRYRSTFLAPSLVVISGDVQCRRCSANNFSQVHNFPTFPNQQMNKTQSRVNLHSKAS